ncbi:MAG: glycosyltransferase family 9 protein [Ignavibacteriaceae bacterium]|nr:glycosyltransferase family 9 protein [Ignavibacteriaceae bacterium]
MQFNFLIIRQDRIGDVVLSLPIAITLRKAFPGCRITVLLRDYARAIYQNSRFVDEIMSYKDFDLDYRGIFSLAYQLRKRKFTHSVMPLPDSKLNLTTFLAGIRVRISNGHKLFHLLTNTKSTYRRKYIQFRHESDYCLDSLRKTGLEIHHPEAEITISETERMENRKMKDRLCPNLEKLIAINTSSGNSAPNLTRAAYLELTKLLVSDPLIKVLITDKDPLPEFESIPGVHFLEDKNDLREMINYLSISDVVVSSSTGPMHIAGALNVPTVSVFCPLPACSPVLWGPIGNKPTYVLPSETYCGNICSGNPKTCSFEGEGGISPGTVYEKILGVLNSQRR